MARQDLVIRIAGEAGEGVAITGQMVTQATARAGYYVLTDSVPPAEIKGGYMYANDKPGLGIDINEKLAASFPYKTPGGSRGNDRRLDGTIVRP